MVKWTTIHTGERTTNILFRSLPCTLHHRLHILSFPEHKTWTKRKKCSRCNTPAAASTRRCQNQMAKQAKVNMMYRGACDAVMDDAMLLYDMMRKKLR
jgi:hypothetical protein